MKHPSEEQLVLFYYGESEDRAGIERHLADCRTCGLAYQGLANTLAQIEAGPVPERGPDYGAAVWERLRPRLAERERPLRAGLPIPRRWAIAGAAAALLVAAAFVAGRHWPGSRRAPAEPPAAQVRERILLFAVSDHLERSQTVLLELVNTRPEGAVDISSEQQRAQDLVAANRLYRQTAARAGEPGLASVLEDLERALLEVAHSPSRLSSEEFERLRQRFEAQGIVFKVRILDWQVRQKATLPPAVRKSS